MQVYSTYKSKARFLIQKTDNTHRRRHWYSVLKRSSLPVEALVKTYLVWVCSLSCVSKWPVRYVDDVYDYNKRGTRLCSWLRHCATSRKEAGSFPDGVIGIFH